MGRSIEAVDTRSAPKALLEEMYEYYAPVYAEELPDDEPVPFERQERFESKIRFLTARSAR